MKIFIATGASGGHIYPALTVADELRRRGHDVVFIGVFRNWQELIQREGFDFVELPMQAWRVKSLKSALISLGCVLKSLHIVLKIMTRDRPDRVLGFGGYGSFPVVLSGFLKRIPAFIHEQNAEAGRANKFLGRIVNGVLVSFPQSVRCFPRKKVTVTGYPVRTFTPCCSREDCLREFGFTVGIPVIAVCGGSQGSRTLNQVMVQAIGELKKQMDVQVCI